MNKIHQKTVAYIVEQLTKTAFLLKIDGANIFKVKAYEKVIDMIDQMGDEFYPYLDKKNYTDIKGVGAGLSKDITELALGKPSEVLESLYKVFPESLFELQCIKGLGAKKIATLFHELNVTSLADLEYACYENRLLQLEGFGQKTQDKLSEQLNFLKKNRDLFTLNVLLDKTIDIENILEKQTESIKYALTGDVRRRLETCAALEYVVALEQQKMMEFLKDQSEFHELKVENSCIQCIFENVPLRFYVCKKNEFYKVLFQTTGSTAYLEEYFSKFDFKKNYSSEEEIFQFLKLPYRVPEQRESSASYSLSIEVALPKTPIENNMIQGVFHMHSTYSDGKNTLEEMVIRSIELGYQYIGISEHSETAFYARGLSAERIETQAKEVSELRKKYPQIIILHGIESDILPDGQLDYPEEILNRLDFVIASVHSSMNQSHETMTKRYITALENPYCTILGHPTGRILLGRQSFNFDLESVFQHAGKLKKIIEINANPKRLDMDWRHMPHALKHNVKFMINPDAHSVAGLEYANYGVNVAKKGGLSKTDVVNTLTFAELKSYLHLGSINREK